MPIKAITKPYLNQSKTKYYLFDYVDANGKTIKGKSLKTTNFEEACKNSDGFIFDLKVDYKVACKQQEQGLLNITREPIVYHQRQIGRYQVSINESFNSIFQDFIDSKENRSKRTREDYTYVRKMLTAYGFDWIHLEKSMFKKFLIYLKNTKKYSPITVANRMACFKIFLNYCVNSKRILPEELIREITCIMPTAPTGNQGHSKIIPDKVFEDLFALIHRDENFEFSNYLFVLYATTSRTSEIRLLKKSLYHQVHGSLNIRQFKTSDWKLMEQISVRLKKMLDELVIGSKSEYFFPNAVNNKRYFSNQWRKYMKELNLIEPKDKYGKTYCTYEMRCLRHTSATKILSISKDWTIVRSALGHSIGTPTYKNYTDILEQSSGIISSNNMGVSTGKNLSRYTQCTKTMNSSTHKKLSENMPFIGLEVVQSENTITIKAITVGLAYTLTQSITLIKTDSTSCKSAYTLPINIFKDSIVKRTEL